MLDLMYNCQLQHHLYNITNNRVSSHKSIHSTPNSVLCISFTLTLQMEHLGNCPVFGDFTKKKSILFGIIQKLPITSTFFSSIDNSLYREIILDEFRVCCDIIACKNVPFQAEIPVNFHNTSSQSLSGASTPGKRISMQYSPSPCVFSTKHLDHPLSRFLIT